MNKDEDFEYKISAFFSDFVFKQGFDGIIYPAVSLGGAGMNIALCKKVVDDNYIKPILALQINNYSLGKKFISDNPYVGDFNGEIIKQSSAIIPLSNLVKSLNLKPVSQPIKNKSRTIPFLLFLSSSFSSFISSFSVR